VLTFLQILCLFIQLAIVLALAMLWPAIWADIKASFRPRVLLWLDDRRDPTEELLARHSPLKRPYRVVHVRKYHQFVSWVEENGLPNGICFDHDLSDIHIRKSTYRERTGMDCAKWLVKYCLDRGLDVPPWGIQSDNTCGRENIDGLLRSYRATRR
jgi:hypothetical protein